MRFLLLVVIKCVIVGLTLCGATFLFARVGKAATGRNLTDMYGKRIEGTCSIYYQK